MKLGMLKLIITLFLVVYTGTCLTAQERDFAGLEVALDQDHYADFLRTGVNISRNFTIGFRVTAYGYEMDNDIMGLPFIRKRIDDFVAKPIMQDLRFRLEQEKHEISFISNGFMPAHISDTTEIYRLAVADGYSLDADRPFSSFTGFRSAKRYEGSKLIAGSARKFDYAFNTAFTFGFAGLGIAKGLQNFFHGSDYFGTERPLPTLWDRDTAKPHQSGQALPAMFPLFMYSLSVEAVVWKPIKTFQLQLRPDVNIGYYTNLGFGFDLGKVMKGDKFIDNLGYTDTHNFSILSVADGYFAYSLVMGGSARLVLYNAHLNGLFGAGDRHFVSFADTRKVVLEGYVGAKVQLFQYVEFMASITTRTPEFKSTNPQQLHHWATMSMKVILNSYN